MAISPETVEEVHRTANVYEVISDYIPLKKAGVNYIALCPFHNEKTPSFVVSPTKNIFKCFGCGVSGDAVKFLMEYEKLSFPEAVVKLANKYGIKVKYIGADRQSQLKPIFEITSKIKDFYKDSLLYHQEAKDYLTKRGVSPQVIKQFEIGYSPRNPEAILSFCKDNSLDVEKLLEIGIFSKLMGGSVVDKFSGRIIFPIKDTKGNVVAFGGRSLEGVYGPKYLNSPESIVYNKSNVLYGLYENVDYIREKEEVVVVEGYMDLLSLWQVGLRNVVATLGTALTQKHAKILSKYVKTVYLMFDNDEAGRKASIQAAKLLLSQGITVKYVKYENSKDPDEFSKFGTKTVLDVVEKAPDILLYTVEKIKWAKSIDDPQERLKSYTKLYQIAVELLSSIKDLDRRLSYIHLLSEELGLSALELQNSLSKTPTETEVVSHQEEDEESPLKKLTVPERAILKTAFQNPYLLKNCDFCDKIIISPILRHYFHLILSEEYEEIKSHIESIEYSIPEELFYQELRRIDQRNAQMLDKDYTIYLSLTEEEKLNIAYEKISKKSLYRRF